MVRNEKKYVTLLRRVLPDEVISDLDSYIEKGKLRYEKLGHYFLEMEFEGFGEYEVVVSELTNLFHTINRLLLQMKEKVVVILIDNFEEEGAFHLLLQYLLPIIIKVIKLRIEKGKYRNYERTKDEQIAALNQIEKEFETDGNGDVRKAFRIDQQVVTELAKILV